jgi:hypothetical protein
MNGGIKWPELLVINANYIMEHNRFIITFTKALCQLNPSYHIPLISTFKNGQENHESSSEHCWNAPVIQYTAQSPAKEG